MNMGKTLQVESSVFVMMMQQSTSLTMAHSRSQSRRCIEVFQQISRTSGVVLVAWYRMSPLALLPKAWVSQLLCLTDAAATYANGSIKDVQGIYTSRKCVA
jgi:hypothetical protein